MNITVRCPSSTCGEVFELPATRSGRNVYCLSCGVRMTARPVEIAPLLAARQIRTDFEAGADIERLSLVVLVDNVRSLWNVGSIFRTADACGVRRLVLTGITGCPPRPEIAKTALGAERAVAWTYQADALDALDRVRAEGYRPVALEATKSAVPLDSVDWPDPVCLVIGNEVAGVSPELLEACEHHVALPMRGIKRSLNVAVAFGIAAFHASRQLARRARRQSHEHAAGRRGVGS